LIGKPERKEPLARSVQEIKDNIKINFNEIEWGGIDWSDFAHDRNQWRALVNTVKNLHVP
jgi:hypothetical protein